MDREIDHQTEWELRNDGDADLGDGGGDGESGWRIWKFRRQAWPGVVLVEVTDRRGRTSRITLGLGAWRGHSQDKK